MSDRDAQPEAGRPGDVRLAVDVGGTFTDIVVEQGDRQYTSLKVLTTADNPEQAIFSGLTRALADTGVAPGSVKQFVHGTTLATNALIERRGARTAFVTTAGFRDVIETRTESRFEQYDLDITLPSPLIARRHRYTVDERRGADGAELLPLDEGDVTALIERLREGAYEAVAVGFLHSYVDPTNEARVRAMLHEALPDLAVSISSEVSPQMREYERFNTVCVNAYVQPRISQYLLRLRDGLERSGIACPLHLVHSGGGLLSVETAAAYPVRLIESGPAGGAIFAADLARRYERDRVLSYDMGGTTAKVSLIDDGRPRTASTFEVDRTARFKKGSGMPISIPVIDMIEIGAGGGSVARIDRLGQIRVGPQSAGAEPGPAAYGLGGDAATVTDANVELGRLDPTSFGAEGLELSPTLAERALVTTIGDALDLDATAAAVGITEVVDESMANAARAHAVERGADLTGYTMIAFGGGAPLHAARLMDKLGIDELIVPSDAGVGSAVGFLVAPFSYEAIRSFYTTTDDFDVAGANAVLDALTSEAQAFVQQGTDDQIEIARRVSMRYVGQGWEIPVALEPEAPFDDLAADVLRTSFTKAYEQAFGRAIDHVTIEAVSWSVTASSVGRAPQPSRIERAHGPAMKPLEHRLVHDSVTGEAARTAVVERSDLADGQSLEGPAVITEPQTTTVLASHHRATRQRDGSLVITRDRDSSDRPGAR